MRARRPVRGRDAGALILSYLIVVPVFMLAVMVIVQSALWYLAREAALAAARQGVDAARIPGAASGAGTQAALAFVRNDASGYLLGAAASMAGPSGGGAGTSPTIQVTVTGHIPTFVPGLVINVSQAAEAPAETFVAP
jgi:Flp pilus assembly protein TadG